MSRLILIIFAILVLSNCAYEPVLSKKKYDFKFEKISSDKESKINKNIKNILYEKSKTKSENIYELNFSTEKNKEIVSSNEKGDPVIFKIYISLNYTLKRNNKNLLIENIDKQITYNSIDDKFELLKYEENIINNLLDNISNEILMSITNILK